MARKFKLVLALGCLAILLVWFCWPLISRSFLAWWLPNWDKESEVKILPGLGQFGDMFGALTSLFTILAFLAVAITTWLQYRALKHQQDQIKTQQATNTASLQLSALTAILNSLQNELSSQTADGTERYFLQSEIARTKGELREMLKAWPEEEGLRLSSQFIDDAPVTQDDFVKEIAPKFTYISENSLRDPSLLNILISRRINSLNRLRQIMGDKDSRNKLELFYIEELNRPPYRILDPLAIVHWLPTLHLLRTDKQFEEFRSSIRNCKEANDHRQSLAQLPLVPVDGGRKHIKASQPCVAVVKDQTVEQFPHFNELKKWLFDKKPEQVKLLVFDFALEERNWVQVNAEGQKI